MRSQALVIAVAVVGGALAFYTWIKQPGQRARFDRALLSLPVIGASMHKFATSQLARTLGTLLGGGIPLVNALDIAAQVDGQPLHRARDGAGRAAGPRGARASPRRCSSGETVPDVAIKMIEVGESTGALQEMLNSLADFYDEEIETEVGRFVTLIEPALLVIMGIVIAAIVLALYMPLFQLSAVIGTR